MNYLLKRVIISVGQLFLVSLACFALFSLVPGDYYSAAAWNPQWSKETIEAWRMQHGLNQPWPLRYALWLRSCGTGDFGTSIAFGIPVSRLVTARIGKTLQIAVPALLSSWTIGLTLAAALVGWAGPRRLRFVESAAAAGNLFPEVLLASLLLWLAVSVRIPLTSMWLPVTGLTLSILPMVFLYAAAAIRTARELPFVQLAERRNIPAARIWLRYILPAASNPLISLFGLSAGGVLGSSLVVEAVAGWPGLGPLLLEAVQARDYPIVQASVMLTACTLAVANLLADLLLYWHDPRIRVQHENMR